MFDQFCVECHKVVKRDEPQRRVNVKLTKLRDVGTDPMMVRNFLNRKVDPGELEGRTLVGGVPISPLKGKDEASAGELVAHFVARSILDKPGEAIKTVVDVVGATLRGKFDQDKIEIYKGRPLGGIWATAPYLHNGSVPTLAELMKLPHKRNWDEKTKKKKSFCVGSRQFLPKEVGFIHDCETYSAEEKHSRFVFDTTIPGNSDSGHAYPDPSVRVLKKKEREALVIYQKSL